jgi:hypothetical protein
MTPFRDFGTDALAPEYVSASKELVHCNWVQSLDDEADTTHISNLHMFGAVTDLPDDGTDRPGYPSNLGTRHIMHAPVDDVSTYRYNFSTQASPNPRGLGGPPFFAVPGYPYTEDRRPSANGTIDRGYTAENDYGVDRSLQKTVSFSGISDFKAQDNMVTETAGPIYNRTREHLGSGDVAVIKFYQALLSAADALRAGHTEALPALSGQGDFRGIRSAEKVLEKDEDWRLLGTDDDPTVQDAGLVVGAAGELSH